MLPNNITFKNFRPDQQNNSYIAVFNLDGQEVAFDAPNLHDRINTLQKYAISHNTTIDTTTEEIALINLTMMNNRHNG